MPKPLEIVLVRSSWGHSQDLRPCVVLSEVANGKVQIMLISAQLDLYRRDSHFLIDKSSSFFKATGLKRTSYISGNQITIEINKLEKRLGQLDGDLAKQFKTWFG